MGFDFAKNENKILKFWEENKIFEKLRKKNQDNKNWSFLDGPITANNPMGVHHAWGRTYKDLFQRYKAMQGFNQRYQNGFDCQGLWVEVEVEKEKGFKNKKDIEKYGIAKFVEDCKQRVLKYSTIQTKQSIRLGQWMDWDNSYYTMSDKNNYTIWNFLKVCKEKGLLYKGRDVVPWCPRCATAISQHEILSEEYKELTHKSIYFKLKLKDKKDEYFLAWTTTPWTLPGNVALAVNPDLEYAKVKKDNEIYILLKEKSDLVGGEVIKSFKGKKLEGLEYEGLFDNFEEVKNIMEGNVHKVILWKDVTLEEGTGIVHTAPGCGAEDFKLAKELSLPIINLSDGESNYREGFGELSGKFVGSSNVKDWIFDNLKNKKLVFKIEDYTHRYPTCWRCKSELIFRLVDEWYISMEKIRKQLIKTAKKINWIPSFGLDRELDWLNNMGDWLISKKRYWGLALPIYECECGNFEVIGSKEELKEKAVSGWDKFAAHSPHKPWIDEVKIKCSKCGKEIFRIKDVGNPWLDAGIVPFSTMPKEWFPAELVTESFPGQFKNWFYSLIVMSTVLSGENPMKTVFGFATVKDENGEEMHKSKGNAIWFEEAVEKIGADPMRWMYAKQNPANDLRFGYGVAEEIKRKLFTLYNVYSFFNTYVDKKDYSEELSSENILDKWILSKFNNLLKDVTKSLDEFNPGFAVLKIENFFIEDLSLWYIRRSRKRFHLGAEDREQTIAVLYRVLLGLSKVLAPVMPFFAEEMYQSINLNGPMSVHLCDFPEADSKLIDKDLENKMAKIREIVSLALAKRAETGIRARQPLSELRIKNYELRKEKELIDLIKDEVNVKEVVFDKDIKESVELNTEITEELKREGEDREAIRNINNIRKKTGLTSKDEVIIDSEYSPADLDNFKKEVKALQINVKDKVTVGEEIKIGDKNYRVFLKKVK